MQPKQEHLIIIGGGSAAFAATTEAKALGVSVTMINDGLPIGGTCVNVGCVPSKYLIRAAHSLYHVRHNPFAGIETTGKVTDFSALIDEKRQLVEQLRQQKYIDIVKDMPDFRWIKGRATLISPTSVKVGDEIIEGSHILIATGASPKIPDIAGLSDVAYLTNEEAFALKRLPESVIVLGGSYIALEIAQLFARFGAQVTILQRSSRLLSKEAADIGAEIRRHLEAEGIMVVTNNDIVRISQHQNIVSVETKIDGEAKLFSAEKIILATGRVPNTEDLGLELAGVECAPDGAVIVDRFLRTNVENIYAAGDVLGSRMFVYAAAYEAKHAVDNMFNPMKKEADFTLLPWVIFTDPQVAGVGMNEETARSEGIDVDTAILPLSQVPRAIVAKDTRGFIKLIRERDSDRLIGARIVAPEGSELLMEVAVAIRCGLKVADLKEMLHPYLTLSEGIKLAAITFDRSVGTLSCCAT
jgi:mercuric reductase